MTLRHLGPADEWLCWSFYDDIYREAFPNPQFAEDPSIWLPRMHAHSMPQVNIILDCEANRIDGGVVVERYATQCWLATYIVVRPSMRHRGVATRLWSEVVRLANTPYRLIFAETEPDPERVVILDKMKFRWVPISYVQPALRASASPSDQMRLLVWNEPMVSPTRVRTFLTEFYASLRQSDSPHLIQMNAELADQEQVWTMALSSSS